MNKETWVNHLLGLAKLEKNIGKKVAFEASADMIKELEKELTTLKASLPKIKADAVLKIKSHMVVGLKGESEDYEKGAGDAFDRITTQIEYYANKLGAGV